MTMRILILDDDQARHDAISMVTQGHEVWHAYDVWQARSMLVMFHFDLALLGHDFGPKKNNNGTYIAQFITRKTAPPKRRPERVIIHSSNVEFAGQMADTFRGAGIWVLQTVFGPEMLEVVKSLCEVES